MKFTKLNMLYGLFICLLIGELSAIPDVTVGESTSTLPADIFPNLTFASWREMKSRPIRPYVGYTTGPGIGYKTGYTTGGVFFTLPRPQNMELFHSFLNFQGNVLNEGKWAYNAGGGIRCLAPAIDQIIGLNVYYDNRRVNKTSFQQAGVGLECLGENWDFRINGYFPVGKRTISKSAFSWPFATRTDVKRALMGFDAEWGMTLKHREYCSPWGIYFAAGPYYYDCKCHSSNQSLWGGRGRVVCQFYDFLTLEFDGSYDPIFRGRFQGRAFFTFPFDLSSFICDTSWDRYVFPCAWQGLWTKALETPRRNDLIVIERQTCSRRP
jgi:hypothetical protein